MPATPFHFGPGLLVKAAAPRQFSMAAYSLAQVVIDIESGFHMLRGDSPVHRQAHTFLLGGLVGLLCGLIVSRAGVWFARRPEAHGCGDLHGFTQRPPAQDARQSDVAPPAGTRLRRKPR